MKPLEILARLLPLGACQVDEIQACHPGGRDARPLLVRLHVERKDLLSSTLRKTSKTSKKTLKQTDKLFKSSQKLFLALSELFSSIFKGRRAA